MAALETSPGDSNEAEHSVNQCQGGGDFATLENIYLILELSLGVAVNCDKIEQIVENITEKLDESTLNDLMEIT